MEVEAETETEAKTVDFSKLDGLVPAVVQHADSGAVLMVGFMNEEALRLTLKTGLVTFFSRSRKRIWVKGETSGHQLKVVSWSLDCDQDSLLFLVKPQGPTCHRGTASCFDLNQGPSLSFLSELQTIISDRSTAEAATSYTAQLLQGGAEKRVQKIGEEAVETVISLLTGTDDQVVQETADLVYHLLVGLSARALILGQSVRVWKNDIK